MESVDDSSNKSRAGRRLSIVRENFYRCNKCQDNQCGAKFHSEFISHEDDELQIELVAIKLDS